MKDPAEYNVRAVERAARILACFDNDSPVLSSSEIAQAVGLHKSTTHRILTTLAHHGFLERASDGIRYRLGLRLANLGFRVIQRMDIRQRSDAGDDEAEGRVERDLRSQHLRPGPRLLRGGRPQHPRAHHRRFDRQAPARPLQRQWQAVPGPHERLGPGTLPGATPRVSHREHDHVARGAADAASRSASGDTASIARSFRWGSVPYPPRSAIRPGGWSRRSACPARPAA